MWIEIRGICKILFFSVEIWNQISGNAFISGEYSTRRWIINGTAAVFTYWNSSYPQNEDSKGCITQQLDPPYRWTNIPCSEHLPYICEVLSCSKRFLWYFCTYLIGSSLCDSMFSSIVLQWNHDHCKRKVLTIDLMDIILVFFLTVCLPKFCYWFLFKKLLFICSSCIHITFL